MARQRDQYLKRTLAETFFVSANGKPLAASTVRSTFRRLCREIGLRGSANTDEPCLHHFRHRFAVETLIRWYRAGEDVEPRLFFAVHVPGTCTNS